MHKLPTYRKVETHMEGKTSKGFTFLFDEEDYESIKDAYWNGHMGYAESKLLGKMHRFLLKDQLSKGLEVDHINRNRADNRRCNLRVVTRQENMHNKSLYKTSTSGHVGITWSKTKQKWIAQIARNKKYTCLGVFDNLQDAIMTRRIAEQEG